MEQAQNQIVELMIKRGNKLLNKPYERIEFTEQQEANELLNNLKKYPHAFVLACVMDRQIKAERAWVIPYEISKEINSFEISVLQSISKAQIKEIFKRKSIHRFNDMMSEYFYLAIQKIYNDYQANAQNIWANDPKSATVVRRFLEFEGVGIKIATMAANILARDFKVPMQDYICIDISPDAHVKRVFRRLGFITENANNDELIYRAREFNPEYPGIFDLSSWEIGRNWCKPRIPKCSECYLDKYCLKII